MSITTRTPALPTAGLALVVLVASACGTAVPPGSPAGASATATASTPASATPEATPSPTAEPSEAATAEPTDEPAEPSGEPSASAAAVDPTEDLTIAPPYTLEPLDRVTAAALQAGLAEGLGAMGDLVQFGARTVKEDGTEVGFLLAMAFPDIPGIEDPSFFDAVLQGAAGSSDGTVEQVEIAGKTVGVMESPSVAFAAYQEGPTVIFVFGTSAADLTKVVEALIEANG